LFGSISERPDKFVGWLENSSGRRFYPAFLFMTKKKTQTANNQNTSYNNSSTSTVGESPDLQSYRDWQPQIDPSIPYRFAHERTHLQDSFNNPLGQYTTPAIREATQRSAEGDLMQQEGQAMREGQYDVNNQMGAKQSYLAGLTAPRTSTSSGTGASSGTGSSVYTPSLLDSIGQVAGIAEGGATTAMA